MKLSEDGTRKLDEVARSEVLLDAAGLARALGASVQEKDGRPAVRVDVPAEGRTLVLEAPRRDLRRFDELVLELHTEGRSVRPSMRFLLASRTRGLTEDDSFSTGRGAVVSLPDWGEYPFPWENFLVFGMGKLVYPLRRLELSLGKPSAAGPVPSPVEGAVWLGALRAQRRDRAEGPRLTDAGLLAELGGAFHSGEEYLTHLRGRTRPKDIYSALPQPAADWTPAAADAICRHFVSGYFVGDPVDWRINPNGYLEWMHAFNRHVWFNELLRAYAATRDARYVRALDELWLSWIRANPEPVGHNGGGDPAWETLSAAVRIYGSWLTGWFALLRDENLRDATRLEILKSFFGHAEHLLVHQGHANNWLVVESRVLFALGLLFPEFRRAGVWLAAGRERLERELARQIFPDGADWELSPGYHMMACQGFLEAYELAKLNGLELPPLFAERLPKTFDYVAGVSRPDGTLPAMNDSGGYRSRGQRRFLEYGARLFNRPELLTSPEGPYAGTSRAFPDSGFHVLASGRGEQALWMLFDGGPPGASHRHDDALCVEVFAMGLPFLVDPGITGYLRDPWTRYYRSTFSHNTVLANGSPQIASRKLPSAFTPSARGEVFRAFGETADFLRAAYRGGYEGLPEGVVHVRAALFVRGAYWVLFDEVAGESVQAMEARFQFVPLRLTIDRAGRRFRTLRQNRPNLELLVACPSRGAKLSIAAGKNEPVGGWVSDGEDLPAPQARIALGGEGPLRLATVIFPFAQGVSSGVRVRAVPAGDGACGLALSGPKGLRDTILYSWTDQPLPPAAEAPGCKLVLSRAEDRFALRGEDWGRL